MEFNATFLVSIISFVLFTAIMNKIFYKPLEKVMAERESFIQDTLSLAKYSSEKADAIIKDKDEKLTKAAINSKKLISDKISETNKYASDMLTKAKSQSQTDINNAKKELADQETDLKNAIQPEIKHLASLISSKILGFETKVEDV